MAKYLGALLSRAEGGVLLQESARGLESVDYPYERCAKERSCKHSRENSIAGFLLLQILLAPRPSLHAAVTAGKTAATMRVGADS